MRYLVSGGCPLNLDGVDLPRGALFDADPEQAPIPALLACGAITPAPEEAPPEVPGEDEVQP